MAEEGVRYNPNLLSIAYEWQIVFEIALASGTNVKESNEFIQMALFVCVMKS